MPPDGEVEGAGNITRRAAVVGAMAGAMVGRHLAGQQADPWGRGVWLNKPRQVSTDDGALNVVTDKGTDFWRETHYGFTRDSGHFLGMAAPERFSAQLRIRGQYEKLYDQAGIMVRVDERRWVKAGIELSDGRAMLSSVLTDGKSDWATGLYDADPKDFWMRATVADGVLRLQVSADGKRWPLVRLAPFPKVASYQVGPMCCTPEREGLKVRFSDMQVSAAWQRPSRSDITRSLKSEKQKMLAGEHYVAADPELERESAACADWLSRYNGSGAEASAQRRALLEAGLREVGKGVVIRPPFHCDYGYNISIGDGVFLNFNCVILDVAAVTIGAGTQIGPGVQILTADHPRDPELRRRLVEFGRPITIGENVWIGAAALLLPGIVVGADAVIGAGSVVTRDVARGTTVVGNPARAISR